MSERIDKLMQATGLKENVLNSLERGDSMFVLTEGTLLFQDGGGTRRVTLRDLKRIHSDHDGLLRVETPAGTALTANLMGFDPSAVQSFFAQVRDATARAKQQSGSTTATPETAPQARPAQVDSPSSLPAPARTDPSSASAAPAGATWTGVSKPSSTPAMASAPTAAAASTPPARTVVTPSPSLPPAPQVAGGLGLSSTGPSTVPPRAAPGVAFKPQEPQVTATPTVKPVVKAVRTPTVITDPETQPRGETTPPVLNAREETVARPIQDTEPVKAAPRVNGSAAGTLASLAAVAGGVSAWIGALKAMSLVMLLATFGMAYFQYDKGQGISGFWTLIAGGMGAVALWVLSDLVKLLVSLAQAVSAEGGVMDVD